MRRSRSAAASASPSSSCSRGASASCVEVEQVSRRRRAATAASGRPETSATAKSCQKNPQRTAAKKKSHPPRGRQNARLRAKAPATSNKLIKLDTPAFQPILRRCGTNLAASRVIFPSHASDEARGELMTETLEIKTLGGYQNLGTRPRLRLIAETIGDTPLVRLSRITAAGEAQGRHPAEARILQSDLVASRIASASR